MQHLNLAVILLDLRFELPDTALVKSEKLVYKECIQQKIFN